MASQDPEALSLDRVWDYLLGRNIAIGIAAMMLLAISGFATWSGMSDFIVGIQETGADRGAGTELLTVAIVVALTFLMWIVLRETVRPGQSWQRIVTLPLYVFLAIWSVGFGYGYWWSLIAGSTATREGLAGQYEDVRDAAVEITARLAAVKGRLDSVVRFSERQMATEEASGGSCGIASSPGRGPLWRARSSVRDAVNALSSDIQSNWIVAVERDLTALDAALGEAGQVQGETLAERQKDFERSAAEIRGRAAAIATRSNALGASFAGELRQLAAELSVRPNQPGYRCFDPALAARLSEAADDAAARAVITLRDAQFSEGPAGVANAVKTIWTKIGVFVWSAAGGADASADDDEKLGQRDLIALLAAIGVDLGLFVLAVMNPPLREVGRLGAFQRQVSALKIASPEVIAELRESLQSAIADAPNLDLVELQRHFISHEGEAYLVAPNLYRCDETDDDQRAEIKRGIAINQVIGVLDEYEITRPLSAKERKTFWEADPRRMTLEHLDALTEDDRELISGAFDADGKPLGKLRSEIERAFAEGGQAGLFAKARRALQGAGWHPRARLVPEVHRLRTGALTPLLRALKEAAGGREPEPAAAPEEGPTR